MWTPLFGDRARLPGKYVTWWIYYEQDIKILHCLLSKERNESSKIVALEHVLLTLAQNTTVFGWVVLCERNSRVKDRQNDFCHLSEKT